MSTKSWGEEGMAEMPNIHMCLTLRIFEQAGCWRNRVLCGHFQKICTLQLTRLREKKKNLPEP
jgi:hypothetical protein